jgi:hypothetical protein
MCVCDEIKLYGQHFDVHTECTPCKNLVCHGGIYGTYCCEKYVFVELMFGIYPTRVCGNKCPASCHSPHKSLTVPYGLVMHLFWIFLCCYCPGLRLAQPGAEQIGFLYSSVFLPENGNRI